MSLESIIKLMSELDLSKKEYREIIKVATEKKKVAPNKTGSTTRKKKDPNAPKRGKTSFMYWCADYREKHQDEGKFSAKVLGPIWSEMDGEEKQPFVDLATADGERYKTEMEAYKSESDGSDTESKDESELTSSEEEAAGVGLEDDAPEFEEDDEETPKKPIEPSKNKTAYKHFAENYVIEHSDRKYKGNELKQIWKELEDKSDYEEMAKADKKRYKQQMKDYEKDLKKYEKAQLKIEEGAETEDLTDDESEW
jgi:high mobility group protein B3